MKKQTDTNKYIELNTHSSLYSEPDKNGKTTLIKSNIPIKISIYLNDITGHEEVFNNKGKVLKGFCRIHHKDIGSTIVKISYEKLKELKYIEDKPQHSSIGFIYKNKT